MPKKSSNSVQIFSIDRAETIKKLEELATELADKIPKVRNVLLFGSVATGEATARSDADIIVIIDGPDDRRIMDRSLEFSPFFDSLQRGADIIVYTKDEWEQFLSAKNPFHLRVQREAIELVSR